MNTTVKPEEKSVKKTIKIAELLTKAKLLPRTSGCYLMKNIRGDVIYVGKAKNLRSRVSSYFRVGIDHYKTEILVGHICDFDFMTTAHDAESFVLENTLIKKYSPKYNIRLKDDKSYPYVVINNKEEFPRLEFMRRVKWKAGKNVEVYGPFVVGGQVGQILRLLTQSFRLRDCSLVEFKSRKEPCILYQMGQCSAPCVGKISQNDYQKDLQFAKNVFLGKGNKALQELEARMLAASENEEFEKAALVRDSIYGLRSFLSQSKQTHAEIEHDKNVDVVAFFSGEKEVDISIYMVRNGLLLGNKDFYFKKEDMLESEEETILNYLFQYYTATIDPMPEQIVTPFSEDSNKILSNGLKIISSDGDRSCEIVVNSKPDKFKSFIELTAEHALIKQQVRLKQNNSEILGLQKLQELLTLKERPIVLECFDIAIFQGKSPTAAQIVFHEGKPDKKQYRHYHLQERVEGNNDFAMMRELFLRRVDKGNFPDVFIVDGGKAQVNIFLEVMKEKEIMIPVVGIAKSKTLKERYQFQKEEVKKTEERLIIPQKNNQSTFMNFNLGQHRALLKLIVQMRDEAHRFSRRLHHIQESKRLLKTSNKN